MLTQEKIQEIKEQLAGLKPEEQQKKLREILETLPPEDREQLIGKSQCPFCLMVEGKLPVRKVYEDDTVLAVLDIRPANPGHTLVFPKQHAEVLATIPQPLLLHLFSVANKLGVAVYEGVQAQGTNIFVANGAVAGQTAPHVLIHVIPRFENDAVQMQWEGKKVDETELDRVLEKIRKKIPVEKPREKKPEQNGDEVLYETYGTP